MFKVEEAACIETHHRLLVNGDVNTEWIQLQVNDMLTEAKSYMLSSLLNQREASRHKQAQINSPIYY